MLFNSLDFAIFLPIVFVLYWVMKQHFRLQNLLIVAASYVFYGWWDARFLGLILLSTVVDFFIGRQLGIENQEQKRKILLWTSVFVNLGLLGFFKYFNFFLENFTAAFSFFGVDFSVQSLQIILPVGISFYTFQTLSYTIDIYKKRLQPTQDFIEFAAFVSFFPQLVAGPIERAKHLLPQFQQKRTFQYHQAVDGLRQMLWGLFKKVVIADNCAEFANQIFNNADNYSGSTLALGAFFFTFQIYGDFSGYSDIAIGTARLFGFDLKQNFAFPYFSRNIAEFWRRWHISLSTWFRDYLYIPLGGSRGGVWMKIRNTFAIFLISGFWHGANWTFMVWGALNALYFLPLLLTNNNRNYLEIVAKDHVLPTLKETIQILFTFGLTMCTWVFFRAENLTQAVNYIKNMFTKTLFSLPEMWSEEAVKMALILVLFFIIIEWIGRNGAYGIEKIGERSPRIIRWLFYSFVIFLIGMYAQTEEMPFIYFQF